MGIGSSLGSALKGILSSEAASEAGQAVKAGAIQQIGGQVGAQVASGAMGTPHALRQRISQVEGIARSPNMIGTTSVDSWFPEFTHAIHVAVAGGPGADIKDVWRLAVSTAFGRFRQRIATFNGVQVECAWDITDKSVSIRITYGSNGLLAAALPAIPGVPGISAVEIIQRGPTAETVGGTWPGFLQTNRQLLFGRGGPTNVIGGRVVPFITGVVAGVTGATTSFLETIFQTITGGLTGITLFNPPANKRSTSLAKPAAVDPGELPDDGRLITTKVRSNPEVQPPRPPDYTNLVAIVSNGLTAPCFLPCPPPTGGQVANPKGERFYSPGNDPNNRLSVLDEAEADANATGTGGSGVDGYDPPTKATDPVIPSECGNDAELRAGG